MKEHLYHPQKIKPGTRKKKEQAPRHGVPGFERYLTTEEVCEITGLSKQFFERARWTGVGGPDFVRINRSVRYPESLFREWLASFPAQVSTSDFKGGVGQ